MNLRKVLGAFAATALTLASLGACAANSSQSTNTSDDSALNIVSTTGYLTDAIKNIAPDLEVTTLVAPGGDPHTQELTTTDIQKVDSADLVVWTSHDMEHRMMDHFDSLGEKSLPAAEAIPEAELLPWENEDGTTGHDPHVWNSPTLWLYVIDAIADKLGKLAPAKAEEYKANAESYKAKILEAHQAASEVLSQIPENKRFLITGHDAFNYLGSTYNLEVHATDFVTSESQMSAAELNELVDLIIKHEVKVIFQDNLKNPEAIKHLQDSVRAKGGSVEISDSELFADTLGETAPVDTYLGAFQHNIDTIAKAFK